MIIDATNEVTLPQGRAPMGTVIGHAVHHTVTTMAATATEAQERAHIRAIDRGHVPTLGLFAYHMAVFPSGRAYLCGHLSGQRAHVAKRNHELAGVVLVGDFSSGLPTAAQWSGLREALLLMRQVYPDKPIRGHREWALPGEGTVCPGQVVPRNWEAFLQEGATADKQQRIDAIVKELMQVNNGWKLSDLPPQLVAILEEMVQEAKAGR